MNAAYEKTQSVWSAMHALPRLAPLQGPIECDTVIVGAGIAGLSIAYELCKAGQTVVVIDRGEVTGGMTSRTTAHLAPVCDDGFDDLIKVRGPDIAKQFHDSHSAAVRRAHAISQNEDIQCDFKFVDGFLFPSRGGLNDPNDVLASEYRAARSLDIPVERTTGLPWDGYEGIAALRYPNQARFDPLKYAVGLCTAIRASGGHLFANSPVTDMGEDGDSVSVATETGRVRAKYAVYATNSPINSRAALHSKMAPYRTYAMAFSVPMSAVPDALYWDTADPYHYVRLASATDGQCLIVGGADHKSGEADDGVARFEALDAWTRALVPSLGKELARWSGQVMETLDFCALIGPMPGSKRSYVASGDSGQGITHGILAGMILRDLITRGHSQWSDVYDPSRTPPGSLANYVSENVTVAKNFASYVLPGDLSSADELAPGQGGILRQGTSLVAACRDLEGRLHLVTSACTHLGCQVRWNSTEQCWDCPCHGSQFAPNGSVLNGPAVSSLKAHKETS